VLLEVKVVEEVGVFEVVVLLGESLHASLGDNGWFL
jgi:hypothetical protein